jgi:hypothetical protein
MLIWGGSNERNGIGQKGLIYDTTLQHWSFVAESVNSLCSSGPGLSATALSDKMLIWGACENSNPSSWTYRGAEYDIASDKWIDVPSAGAPKGRFSAAVASFGGSMLLWGGLEYRVGSPYNYMVSVFDGWIYQL